MEDQAGREQNRRTYEAHRDQIWSQIHDAHREQDKAVLALSASLLGLSMGFVSKVVPLPEATSVWMLFSSWAALAGAVVITLLSFPASRQAGRERLPDLKAYYEDGDDEAFERSTRALRVLSVCNWTSLPAFIVGLTLTVGFAVVNADARVGLEGQMAEKEKSETVKGVRVQGGATLPPMEMRRGEFAESAPPPPMEMRAPDLAKGVTPPPMEARIPGERGTPPPSMEPRVPTNPAPAPNAGAQGQGAGAGAGSSSSNDGEG